MGLVRSGFLILLTVALNACGISSDYDIGKELHAVTPIRAGIYAEDAKKAPTPVALRGNTYLVETKNQNGSKGTLAVHFYRIPEFDGYIMQLKDSQTDTYSYFFTRVTNTRLEILDEEIATAVLPPHLAKLFVFEKLPGQVKEENDENEKEDAAGSYRTTRLKSGRSILVILRAMAGAKYPMKSFGVLKRIG